MARAANPSKFSTESQPELIPVIKPSRQPRMSPENQLAGKTYSKPPVSPDDDIVSFSVYHLPNFDRDHRWDPQAEQISVAENCPAGSDAEIQVKRSGLTGWFVVRPRSGKGFLRKAWTFKVGPIGTEDVSEPSEIDLAPFQGASDSADELSALRQELAFLKGRMQQQPQMNGSILETVKAMEILNQLKQPERTPAKSIVDQVRELKEVQELIAPKQQEAPQLKTEKVQDPLLKIIEDLGFSSQDVLKAILKLPVNEPESKGAIDRILDGLLDFAPAIAPLIAAKIVEATTITSKPAADTRPGPQPAEQHPVTSESAQPSRPPEHRVAVAIINGLEYGLTEEFVAEELFIISAGESRLETLINAFTVCGPDQLIAWILDIEPQAKPILARPTTPAWIKNLQVAIVECVNGENTQEGTPSEDSTTKVSSQGA